MQDARQIQQESQEIEKRYGRYFDCVLVLRGANFPSASRELLEVINLLDVEPQWVPAAWLGGNFASSASISAAQKPPTSSDGSPATHVRSVIQEPAEQDSSRNNSTTRALITDCECDAEDFRSPSIATRELWARAFNCRTQPVLNLPLQRPMPGKIVRPTTVHPTGADGNCLFRAMAWIITGSESDHTRIRNSIVKYMKMYRISGNLEHINRMATECTYGEDWELAAFASALNTPIHVYSVESGGWNAIHPYSDEYGTLAIPPLVETEHQPLFIRLSGTNSGGHFEPITEVSTAESSLPPQLALQPPTTSFRPALKRRRLDGPSSTSTLVL